jgi:hypothetical protein
MVPAAGFMVGADPKKAEMAGRGQPYHRQWFSELPAQPHDDHCYHPSAPRAPSVPMSVPARSRRVGLPDHWRADVCGCIPGITQNTAESPRDVELPGSRSSKRPKYLPHASYDHPNGRVRGG